jgi:hypothetical protein
MEWTLTSMILTLLHFHFHVNVCILTVCFAVVNACCGWDMSGSHLMKANGHLVCHEWGLFWVV